MYYNYKVCSFGGDKYYIRTCVRDAEVLKKSLDYLCKLKVYAVAPVSVTSKEYGVENIACIDLDNLRYQFLNDFIGSLSRTNTGLIWVYELKEIKDKIKLNLTVQKDNYSTGDVRGIIKRYIESNYSGVNTYIRVVKHEKFENCYSVSLIFSL